MSKLVQKACVIGDPIGHSLSPYIHSNWIKQFGLSADYSAQKVTSAQFPKFMAAIKAGDLPFIGGNVTLPHKELLLKCADEVEEAARIIGAANTFWVESGKLVCTNTDAYGFRNNLDDRLPNWSQRADGSGFEHQVAIVFGAGGASRAIIYSLLQTGFERIIIVNRNQNRAIEVKNSFSTQIGTQIDVISYSEVDDLLPEANMVVNTTSLGMLGQPDLDICLDGLAIDAVVTDIVYTPLQTKLLKDATQRGNRIVDGIGMLLHQAVPGFEKWFGVKPQVSDHLRASILTRLDDK